VEQLYRLLFARTVLPDELALAKNFLGNSPNAARWQSLVQALLLANEFAFID